LHPVHRVVRYLGHSVLNGQTLFTELSSQLPADRT